MTHKDCKDSALAALRTMMERDETLRLDLVVEICRDEMRKSQMDELQETVETLIDLDEPETILPTLRHAAERRKGARWQALARVIGEAEVQLDLILNAKPAGPDFRPDSEAEKE